MFLVENFLKESLELVNEFLGKFLFVGLEKIKGRVLK